jgi:hypothetical protein
MTGNRKGSHTAYIRPCASRVGPVACSRNGKERGFISTAIQQGHDYSAANARLAKCVRTRRSADCRRSSSDRLAYREGGRAKLRNRLADVWVQLHEISFRGVTERQIALVDALFNTFIAARIKSVQYWLAATPPRQSRR